MDTLTATLVGGPTVILELGGLRLITDPTFSPPGEYESAPGRVLTKTEAPAVPDAGPVDAILLSHDQHPDNLDPAGLALVRSAPLTLTTPAGAERLGGAARGLQPWQPIELPRPGGGVLEVTALPARHGPDGAESQSGPVTGFLLRSAGLPTVYFSGDNASVELVRDISAQVGAVDIAVLCAGAARSKLFDGAPLTLTAADTAAAADIIGARHVIPIHVRGWAHFTETADDVRAAFAATGLGDRLLVLPPGKPTPVG